MRHRQDVTNKAGDIWCPKCEAYKRRNEFYAVPGRERGVSGYCKPCTNAYRKERYARGLGRNPRVKSGLSRTRDHSVVSGANTNARVYGCTDVLNIRDWMTLRDSFSGRCLACGTTEGVGIDHVIPLSRGGSNTIDNVQPLCTMCNRRKTTQIIDYRVSPPMVIDASMSHIDKRYCKPSKPGMTRVHLQIVALAEQGLSPAEIAAEVGVCARTVYRVVRGR